MTDVKKIKVNPIKVNAAKGSNGPVLLPEVRAGLAIGKKVGGAVTVGVISTDGGEGVLLIPGAEIGYNGGNKTAHAAASIGVPVSIDSNLLLTTVTAKAGAEFDFKGNVDVMGGLRVDVSTLKLIGGYVETTYSGRNGFTAQIGVQVGIVTKKKD